MYRPTLALYLPICASVRPSVCLLQADNMLQKVSYRIMQTTLHNSRGSNFSMPKIFAKLHNYKVVTPGEFHMQMGRVDEYQPFRTNILLYLKNGKRRDV